VRQLKHDPSAVRSLTACSGCGAPGVTLLLGVWLALGPGRAVSKKFRFYPWMQQCGAVATAILVWFGCLAAAAVSLAASDHPWSHLPATHAVAFAYNAAVLLSLPVVWLPKAAAATRALQDKHSRVTTLHSLISANDAPWYVRRSRHHTAPRGFEWQFSRLQLKLKLKLDLLLGLRLDLPSYVLSLVVAVAAVSSIVAPARWHRDGSDVRGAQQSVGLLRVGSVLTRRPLLGTKAVAVAPTRISKRDCARSELL
jgi:hypothetical protein